MLPEHALREVLQEAWLNASVIADLERHVRVHLHACACMCKNVRAQT